MSMQKYSECSMHLFCTLHSLPSMLSIQLQNQNKLCWYMMTYCSFPLLSSNNYQHPKLQKSQMDRFWIRLYLSWGLMLINEPTENSEKANVIEQVTLHKHWNTKSYWHYIQNHFIQWLVNVPVIDFILWLSACIFVS